MKILPAVDVLGGRVVRLRQGDYGEVTDYGDSPAEQVAAWRRAGAEWVHVIDLDGARTGKPDPKLWNEVTGRGAAVQWGGGIRGREEAEAAFRAGIDRVIMGTAAVWEPSRLAEAAAGSPERVMAAVDVKDGRAAGRGWLEEGRDLESVVESVLAAGVGSLLVTAVRRDGTLQGPDWELLSRVRRLAPEAHIQAAGGIAGVDDLRRLSEEGMDGAVVGRALYEGAVDLAEALRIFA